jgi:hypothetical protein
MKDIKMFKTRSVAVVVASSLGAVSAFATDPTGPDLTSLTSAVQLGTVTAAILAVAAIMIGIKLVQLAIRKVKGAVN